MDRQRALGSATRPAAHRRHRAGVEAVRAAVDTGARLGLGALTLYAFSTENWKRPLL